MKTAYEQLFEVDPTGRRSVTVSVSTMALLMDSISLKEEIKQNFLDLIIKQLKVEDCLK